MTILNNLEISITRYDDSRSVRSVEIVGGEPDACGHRYIVRIDQPVYGCGFHIQTNFSDFYEQRSTLEQAYGTALKLASFIDPTVPVDTYAPEAE